MKTIKLKNGEEALVDDEDYEELNKYRWFCSNGYVVRGRYSRETKKTSSVRIHRVIMNPPDYMDVDHINHNKLDNRKENLRVCTASGNQMNRDKFLTRNTSGYKGVSWSKDHRKWDARIKKDGKNYWLGLFVDVKEAHKAYQQKAKELFGEFNYYE